MEVVASFSQGRTAAAQCGLFTHKSVLVIFEPPCTSVFVPPCSDLFCNELDVTLHYDYKHRRCTNETLKTPVQLLSTLLFCYKMSPIL